MAAFLSAAPAGGGETKHKRFGNGDSYSGGWRNGMVRGAGAARCCCCRRRRQACSAAVFTKYPTPLVTFPSPCAHSPQPNTPQPYGEGKYCFADGSVYTGSWKDGAKHGVGSYQWPSGACYHGAHARGAGSAHALALSLPPPSQPQHARDHL